jgi:hypothetical protein
MSNMLQQNSTLTSGQQLVSPNGSTVLSLQQNGQLSLLVNGDPIYTFNPPSPFSDPTSPSYKPNVVPALSLGGNVLMLLADQHSGSNVLWQSQAPPISPGPFNSFLEVLDSQQISLIGQFNQGSEVTQQTLWTLPTSPTPGDQFTLGVDDGQGNNIFQAAYAYDDAGSGTDAVGGTQKRWKLIRQTWADDRYKPKSKVKPSSGADVTVSEGLAVLKAVWEFVKENEVQVDINNSSTSILSAGDTNAIDYPGAKSGTTEPYRIYGTVWPTSLTQFDVQVALGGYYGATEPPNNPSVVPGFYLPNVRAMVPRCDVYWPYSLNAHAQVTVPVNVSTGGSVIAEANIILTLDIKSFFTHFHTELTFTANGVNGFTFDSAVGD